MTIRSLALLLALSINAGVLAHAQTDAPKPGSPETTPAHAAADDAGGRFRACETGPIGTRFFSLANASQQSEASDILTALRNILCPSDKVFLVGTQNVIVVSANAEQLALAQRIIAELDHARKSYRLVYTVNELDNGRLVGSQHYAMVVVTGQLTTLKQGSKIPILTGSTSDNAHTGTQTQFQYLDVGMNFAVTLDELTTGVRLRSKVEESSVGETKVIADVGEPVIRQAVLEGAAFLTPGKPVTLGSIDLTGTTRRLEIEVVLDPVR